MKDAPEKSDRIYRAHQSIIALPMTARMDDNDRVIQEGFSQEECIEWEENANVDLRSLAHSPHMMPFTPALAHGTQTSAKRQPSSRRQINNEDDTPPVSNLVKNLEKNYSPKQEIAHLLEPAGKAQEAARAAHEAPTQPLQNVARNAGADTLGMRHGRRRRESISLKQPKKLKRSNTDPSVGRRRPRSSRSMTSVTSVGDHYHGKQRTTSSSDGGDFEDLLKELDEPRVPLHPAKVNMPVKGDSKRAMTKGNAHAKMNVPRPLPASRSSALPAATNVSRSNTRTQTQDFSKPIPTTAMQSAPTVPPTIHNPYPPKTVSVTMSNDEARPVSVPKRPVAPVTIKTSPAAMAKTASSSLIMEDDFKLSEDEWAQIMSQAEGRRETVPPKKTEEAFSTENWKAIQAIDESLARAVGHPSVVETKQPTGDDAMKDEFDDFPMIDFEALDRQIAERSTGATELSNPTASTIDSPVWNPVSPSFDPQHSYIAFSRYKVVETKIDNTTYTKTVFLKVWETAMLKEQDKRNPINEASSVERYNAAKSETDQETADGQIFLRGEWYHTHVDAGDVAHLCSLSGKYRTDVGALPVILHTNPPQGSDTEDDLVLVVHPDQLIPPTTICETVTCSRRAVLRMRLGSTGISSKAALFGTMRHELFERCMSNQDFSWQTAKVTTSSIVRRNAESLVGCGIRESEARTEVLKVVPQIQRFAAQYTTFSNKAGSAVSNAAGAQLNGNGIQPDMQFVANSVQATEEAVVCPELGLKGNLDVTVTATTDSFAGVPQTSSMCIELKTGHNQEPQHMHMAQLALYTVMLRVRRGPNIPLSSLSKGIIQETQGACESGMLLYLNHENYRAIHVSPMLNEIKSLIGQRNLVASELTRSARPRGVVLAYEEQDEKENQLQRKLSTTLLPATPAALPEVLATPHSCSRCFMNRECMTYAAAELRVPTSSSSKSFQGVDKSHAKLLQHFTGHLDEDCLAYFQEFDRLIDIEADASTFMTTTAWLQHSQEQEKASGKCVSSLVLDEFETMIANANSEAAHDHRSALIVMSRAHDSALATPLSRLNIERGSHVILSSDATLLHLSSRHNAHLVQENRNAGVRHFRNRMSIARGFLESIDEKQLTIRVSRDELGQLSRLLKQHSEQHQPLAGSSSSPQSSHPDSLLRFRLDKDDVSTGIGTLRQNLIKFLTSDVKAADEKDAASRASKQQNIMPQELSHSSRERLPWLRDAIIRMHPPSFDEGLRKSMFGSRGDKRCDATADDFLSLASEFSELNDDQRNAVEKIMCAKDYSLVQGLPGTGKTSTIAFVARLLAAHGKRVLITSYTHAAVDNLMMKLIESGIAATNPYSSPLIRIGNKSSCHPNVHSIMASTVAIARESRKEGDDEFPSPDSLSSVLSSAKIVGVSALTIPRSSLLVGQHFDVVIVDEAGQISQPAILGALMAADSFVLVGDHMQLPPLVHSEAAEQGGYNISMLKRLADKHASAVAQLTLQYRMHSSICQLSNDIVYDGKLKCANKEIETRLLCLPGFPSAIFKHARINPPDSCWMVMAIDPSRPVVFLDTDRIQRIDTPIKSSRSPTDDSKTFISGLERTTGKNGKGSIVNDTEANLVRQFVHALLECGLEPSKIGVICPFRSQLRLLGQSPSAEEWKSKGLEFSTIDRYQGRDKPVIILSLVRSNGNGNCGRLLEDFRRLNVAVSRAKYKLVIIGSFTTLTKGSDVLRPVLQKMQNRNQILQLPKNASLCYTAA